MKAKNKPYPDAEPAPVFRCPWCNDRIIFSAATVAERWDHAIDFHLAELKNASAQTLNLIVSPR